VRRPLRQPREGWRRDAHDDSDERAGAKFSAFDLYRLPWQLIVGPRGLAQGQVEIKNRKTGERQTLSPDAALNLLTRKS